MSFLRNIYKVATSVCRKDKSLNRKRANPFVDITQTNIVDLEEDINEQEKLELILPKNKLNPKEKDNSFNEEEANNVIQESVIDKDDQEERIPKESLFSPKSNKALKSSKEEEQTEAADIEAYSSTEDSEEENQEEQGPYKKRKMDLLSCNKEEEKITRHWTDDLKSIKKSIGRMNRLFEIYEGYKKKRDPLTISPDKMLEELEIIEKTQELEEEVIEDFQKENMPNRVNQSAELFVAFEKQIQNNIEFYQVSPMKTRVEQQSRRQSCAQDLLVNMATLLDPAGVGI